MRRILIFAGSRADYGPLLPLLRELEAARRRQDGPDASADGLALLGRVEHGGRAAAPPGAPRRVLRRAGRSQPSPYSRGGGAEQIASVLASVALDGIVLKRFHDLPVPSGGPPPQ